MYRKKILLTGAALFALGVAFAAQPTSDRAAGSADKVRQVAPWVPGTNMLMSAHEPSIEPLAPPR